MKLERDLAPPFLREEILESMQEVKRRVTGLVRFLPDPERNVFLKGIFRQAVEEEIDRATELRGKRCLRCIHVQYFDQEGCGYAALPFGKHQASSIGCRIARRSPRSDCEEFRQSPSGISLQDYLEQMTLLYELREMFEEIEEMWDYLTK